MIEKAQVVKLVEDKLDESMFLVEITISKINVIHVFVDSFNGLTIDKCTEISRYLELNLDRDNEDFELQVSSPGLTESFKVKQQYYKYKGREIEIVSADDLYLKGLLKDVNDEGVVLEITTKEIVEGQKKKQKVVKEHNFKYNKIKSAKAVITFK